MNFQVESIIYCHRMNCWPIPFHCQRMKNVQLKVKQLGSPLLWTPNCKVCKMSLPSAGLPLNRIPNGFTTWLNLLPGERNVLCSCNTRQLYMNYYMSCHMCRMLFLQAASVLITCSTGYVSIQNHCDKREATVISPMFAVDCEMVRETSFKPFVFWFVFWLLHTFHVTYFIATTY